MVETLNKPQPIKQQNTVVRDDAFYDRIEQEFEAIKQRHRAKMGRKMWPILKACV